MYYTPSPTPSPSLSTSPSPYANGDFINLSMLPKLTRNPYVLKTPKLSFNKDVLSPVNKRAFKKNREQRKLKKQSQKKTKPTQGPPKAGKVRVKKHNKSKRTTPSNGPQKSSKSRRKQGKAWRRFNFNFNL
jgi:hypothetical protein